LLTEKFIRLSDEGFTLLRMSELKQQLEMRREGRMKAEGRRMKYAVGPPVLIHSPPLVDFGFWITQQSDFGRATRRRQAITADSASFWGVLWISLKMSENSVAMWPGLVIE